MTEYDEERYMWINDEPELPKLSKDFASNVKKHFEEKAAKDSSRKKRLGPYGAGLVARIKANKPHLTEEEIEDMLDSLA